MELVTSTRNERVRDAAALARRRVRRDTGRHLVEGPNVVAEALAAGVVEEVFATPEAAADLHVPDGVRVTHVADHVLERLSGSTTPQGIVAVARTDVAAPDAVVGRGLMVVLHEVADPGNAGAIVRTADAAGAHTVVLTRGSVDPFGPKAIRAAAGSTYHLPVALDIELAALAAACREVGQPLVGLDAAAERSVFELRRRPPPIALVLGNEAHGLPAEARTLLDDTVAIPQWGAAESLNVAAAAAVALYAAARAVHDPVLPEVGR